MKNIFVGRKHLIESEKLMPANSSQRRLLPFIRDRELTRVYINFPTSVENIRQKFGTV